jgi:hypothetical protein
MIKCLQCYQDLIANCYYENNELFLHQICLRDHELITDFNNYTSQIEIRCDICNEIYEKNKNEFFYFKTQDKFLCKNCIKEIPQNEIFNVVKLSEINNDYKKEKDKNKICYSLLKNKLFCEEENYKKKDETIFF